MDEDSENDINEDLFPEDEVDFDFINDDRFSDF